MEEDENKKYVSRYLWCGAMHPSPQSTGLQKEQAEIWPDVTSPYRLDRNYLNEKLTLLGGQKTPQ